MKQRIMVFMLVVIGVFTIPFIASGQSPTLNLLAGEKATVTCQGQKLVLSRESSTKASASCTANSNPSPTNTPTSSTPPPPPTATPVASVPLCPDHDPTKWHALYDEARNCHYNHEHHSDPREGDNIFGPVAALYGGQEISYPWQTFSDRGLENDVKHEGYKWVVRKNMDCSSRFTDGCLTDFRMQVHFIASAVDATVRYHSFWLEARGCREDNPEVCGIIRTGGWADYGRLMVDNQHIPLPGDPPAPTNSNKLHYIQTGNSRFTTWYGGNRIATTAIQTSRMWGLINPNDPYQLHLFCPDFKCRNNNSTMQAHAIGFVIRANELDQDGDGLVNYEGYTNRHGEIVSGCTEVGLDCVPLQIINMPTGLFQYRDDEHGRGNDGGINFDTSPEGEYWIAYPN